MWVDYFDSNHFDVIVVPTTPITARPIGAAEPFSEINGRLEETLHVYSRTAEIDCPSAVPGLSLPIGPAADGLPIGLQLHSRPGEIASNRGSISTSTALDHVYGSYSLLYCSPCKPTFIE